MVYSREFWLNTLLMPYSFLQRNILTSSRQGYYMSSERSLHFRTMIAWPDEASMDNTADLFQAQQEISSIANAIAKYEPVWLYTKASNCRVASTFVSQNVTIIPLDFNDPWVRDTGPVIVTSQDGQFQAGIDFHCNDNKPSDASNIEELISNRILATNHLETISSILTLTPSALEADGNGTLLATTSSIAIRNPTLTTADVEAELRHLLGVTKIIWLPGSDDLGTINTHINTLARFGPDTRTILLSRPNDAVPHDTPAYERYDRTHAILSAATNAVGERFRIIELEEAFIEPREHHRPTEQGVFVLEEGPAAVTSYVDFYLPNGAVLVPQFGDKGPDREAREVLERLFQGRVVEGVGLEWMAGLGRGVRCATMPWPKTG